MVLAMTTTVFRKVVEWIHKFTHVFGYLENRPKVKISLNGILDFLTFSVCFEKLKDVSYMELIRICHHNITSRCVQFSLLIISNPKPHPCCQGDSENMSKSTTLSSPYICDVIILPKDHIQSDEIKYLDDSMKEHDNIQCSTSAKIKNDHVTIIYVENKSPPIKSKFFVRSLSSSSDSESESSMSDDWDDDDDDDDVINDNMPSLHCDFKPETQCEESSDYCSGGFGPDEEDDNDDGDDEIDDDEDDDEEDGGCYEREDDDSDILFCDKVFTNVNQLQVKRVRFKSHPGLYDVDKRWSEDELMDARKGPWEECARDRARFARRIGEAEQKIAWIFDENHRNKMTDYNKTVMSSNLNFFLNT